MSTENKVQLKREEVVGDEVVLSDIYPVSETESVIDSANGTTLNITIERLQQAINNKLSRLVNSVNGRTGVVVLTSEDVGLSNVDNVSFNDIKQWVIEYLKNEFNYKRLGLYDTLDDVISIIQTNDLHYRDKPFFCERGLIATSDKKSYIGYIYYDDSTNHLNYVARSINTIGKTDNSILYDEDSMSGGGLGINLYPQDDEILTVVNSTTKATSGLGIERQKITPYTRGFADFYKNDSTTGFLLPENGDYDELIEQTDYAAQIYLNGSQIQHSGGIADDGIFYIDPNFVHAITRLGDQTDTIYGPHAGDQMIVQSLHTGGIPEGTCSSLTTLTKTCFCWITRDDSFVTDSDYNQKQRRLLYIQVWEI